MATCEAMSEPARRRSARGCKGRARCGRRPGANARARRGPGSPAAGRRDRCAGQAADSPAGPAPPEAAEDPQEDVYEASVRRNIQGNIVPGFNKDHQHFLFYRITQAAPAKRFLRDAAPSITSMDEALEFVRVHRAQRLRLGVAEPPGLEATWINIAFSGRGIEKLAGAASLEAFGEQSFCQGLAERSTYLGDPTDPAYRGHRSHWKVGGPHSRELRSGRA